MAGTTQGLSQAYTDDAIARAIQYAVVASVETLATETKLARVRLLRDNQYDADETLYDVADSIESVGGVQAGDKVLALSGRGVYVVIARLTRTPSEDTGGLFNHLMLSGM